MKTFESLGAYLLKKRQEKGLTQAGLAKELGGLHSQFVSNWERGLCAPPSHIKKKLAKVLKINEEHLWQALMADAGREVGIDVSKRWGLKYQDT